MEQEVLHSLKNRKEKGFFIKIVFSKECDRLNCIYIKLPLPHLGFEVHFLDCIMSCVTSVSFVVLINVSTSSLIGAERGPRQGCPL